MLKKNTIWKSLCLLHKMDPVFLPMQVACKTFAMAQTFVTLILSSKILDMVVEKQRPEIIMKVVVVMTCSSAALILLRWGLESILRVKEQEMDSRVDASISAKCYELDYEILEKKETLDMVHKARESYSIGGGIYMLCEKLASVLEAVLTIEGSIALVIPLFIPVGKETAGHESFLNQWYCGVILALILAVSVWIRYRVTKTNEEKEKKLVEKTLGFNRAFSYFMDYLHKYEYGKDIRMYHMQDKIVKTMKSQADELEERARWKLKYYAVFQAGQSAAGFLASLSCYLYVGAKGILKLISIGNVVCYCTSILKLLSGLNSIMDEGISLKIRADYMAHYYDFLELENKKYEGTLPVEKRDDNRFQLEFRDVSFHYPGSEKMVLDHVSMKFEIGEKMAVVGPNGAGKSTFIKLLCRLYDPTEGEILLNGINIQLYDYEQYLKIFSVVFQDYKLFSFSLAQNVAGALQYDSLKLERCLQEAGFGDRLESMEQGMETNIYQIQEKGVEISGGEAQKIALARALYKDAPVVILDEPTAALDPVSEYETYKRFHEMVQNKTAVFISHRMSSCRFCSRILVFNKGQIVQDGTHEDLLQEKGSLYEQMWEAQAQYYQ